ncbi:MAG TPA: hypothetical protein PLV85_03065, partial [Polyangiaceae bacterium]|nr:hypothetical protein [Polyangiaceae bacterium]
MHRYLFILLATAVGFGCASTPPVAPSSLNTRCQPTDLASCEAGLKQTLLAATPDTWTQAYVEARAVALGSQDPWVTLHHTFRQRGAGTVVLMVPAQQKQALEVAVRHELKALGSDNVALSVIEQPRLPKLQHISEQEMMFALARVGKVEQVLWFQDDALARVLGTDLLSPLVFQLPAIMKDRWPTQASANLARPLAEAIAWEHLTNDALQMLGHGAYEKAASLVFRLDTMLTDVPTNRTFALRARRLLSHAHAFGASLPKRKNSESKEQTSTIGDVDVTDQGAYSAWLRISLADKDGTAAWQKHRAVVASACTAERTALLDWFYSYDSTTGRKQCFSEGQPIPEAALYGDPLFAIQLAQRARQGTISALAWADAYEALVERTETQGLGWYVLPQLLFERGELPGMSARGSKTYTRVTRLAVDHFHALGRFQQSTPEKYSPTGQLTFALLSAALSDPEIVNALHPLLADNIKYELTTATTSSELLETTVVLAVMGAMLPDPFRAASLGFLQRELDNKLHSGFDKSGGWGAAALYLANGFGAYALGNKPNMAFTGDGIIHALESESTEGRPLALVTARGVQYATLAATGELEPEKIGGAKVGEKRAAARARLDQALRSMAEGSEPIPNVAQGHLTTLIDGLIATSALMFQHSSKRDDHACATHESARSLASVQKNLKVLTASRNALMRDPALRAGASAWARRAALLSVIASDVLDWMATSAGASPKFQWPSENAKTAIAAALSEWTRRDVAVGIASLHAIARSVAATDGNWESTLDTAKADLVNVLTGTTGLMGTQSSLLTRAFLQEATRIFSETDTRSLSESSSKLVDIADALFKTGQKDQASMVLLLSGALSHDAATTQRAAGIAVEQKDASAWYLLTHGAVQRTTVDSALDAALYERGLRAVTDDACTIVQLDPLAQVAKAVQGYAQGEGMAAVDKLHRVLEVIENKGLYVPRVQYRLHDPFAGDRVLRLEMYMTTGQGFIAENSFSLGVDVFSSASVDGLRVEVLPAVDEDAGRYYAHIASLAAIYDWLEARDDAGSHNAERMLNAVVLGVRLGHHGVKPTDPKKWISDLDPSLQVAAELASRRGHILLAGSLWSMALESKDKRPADKPFSPPEAWKDDELPVGLRALARVRDLKNAVYETQSLIEQASSCDVKQRPIAPKNLNSCESYRRAIALWRAGVYESPPTMREGAAEACTREAILVGLLQDISKNSPFAPRIQDAIVDYISTATQRGHDYDALMLLRAMRDRGICDPRLVQLARRIGSKRTLTPHARVDWVGYSLTCPGRNADDTIWQDLRLLAESSEQIGDAQISQRIYSAIVRYMVNLRAWDRLEAFSRDEGFVRAMNQTGPAGAATSLLIQHTAAT